MCTVHRLKFMTYCLLATVIFIFRRHKCFYKLSNISVGNPQIKRPFCVSNHYKKKYSFKLLSP